jgi:C4-dicarboxylate transporter, DctM subunit
MITPPVGLNLFVTAGISQLPVTAVIRAALPWLAVLLAALAVVTYVPWLSLVLLQALG